MALSEPRPKRKPKNITAKAPLYRRNQKTSGGVESRARARLKRTGKIKGVNAKDGITGGEARKIRRVAIDEGVLKGRRPASRDRRPRQEVDPFRSEVNAEAQLRFGPQERELQFQRDQSAQFSQNLGGWYAQHVKDVQQAQRDQQVFQQGLLAGQNQAVTNAYQIDAQQQAPEGVNSGIAQQAAAARQQLGQAGTNMLAQQGSAQGTFLANQVNVAGQQGLQAQQDEMNRKRRLDQLAADLAADKGAFKVDARRQIQDTQHKQRLEDAAFGLDVSKERFDRRDARADNRLNRRRERNINRDRRIDNRRQAQTEAERRRHNRVTEQQAQQRINKDRRGLASRGLSRNDIDGDGIADRGKYRGYSESERDKFDQASRLLRRKGITSKNAQQALDALINEEHIPPRIAKRALHRYMQGRRRHAGSLTPRNPDGTPG